MRQIYPMLMVYIVCAWLAVIITPSPKHCLLIVSIVWNGAQRGRKKGSRPTARREGALGAGPWELWSPRWSDSE